MTSIFLTDPERLLLSFLAPARAVHAFVSSRYARIQKAARHQRKFAFLANSIHLAPQQRARVGWLVEWSFRSRKMEIAPFEEHEPVRSDLMYWLSFMSEHHLVRCESAGQLAGRQLHIVWRLTDAGEKLARRAPWRRRLWFLRQAVAAR